MLKRQHNLGRRLAITIYQASKTHHLLLATYFVYFLFAVAPTECDGFCLVLVCDTVTIKPRNFELRMFEIPANSNLIWDTIESKNRAYV